jgi:hypothetical protein
MGSILAQSLTTQSIWIARLLPTQSSDLVARRPYDVQAIYQQKLFSLEESRDCFEAIKSELIRFPSLNLELLRNRVEQFIKHFENTLERE